MLRALLASVVVVLGAAGCGGGGDRPADDPRPRAERPAPAPSVPEEPRGGPERQLPPGLALPRDVPTAPDGPAPRGAEPVIRAWLAAVREADFDRAAGLFARGARVQNGGPVARLATRAQALRWNQALPCGAKLTQIRGNDGYAIVRFELVDRAGGECGSGRGARAYGAIRVRDGRITDWFRLPDPIAPPQTPDAPDAPDAPFV